MGNYLLCVTDWSWIVALAVETGNTKTPRQQDPGLGKQARVFIQQVQGKSLRKRKVSGLGGLRSGHSRRQLTWSTQQVLSEAKSPERSGYKLSPDSSLLNIFSEALRGYLRFCMPCIYNLWKMVLEYSLEGCQPWWVRPLNSSQQYSRSQRKPAHPIKNSIYHLIGGLTNQKLPIYLQVGSFPFNWSKTAIVLSLQRPPNLFFLLLVPSMEGGIFNPSCCKWG